MKRDIYIMVVIFIAIVALTAFIFCNSIEKADESADKSEELLNYNVKIMEIENTDQAKMDEYHKTLRKIAHGVEFTILGVLLALFFRRLEKITERKYICFPLLAGLCVGVTDEFIQSFNDRSSEVADVLIDFGGIVAGVAVTMLIFVLIDKKRKSL